MKVFCLVAIALVIGCSAKMSRKAAPSSEERGKMNDLLVNLENYISNRNIDGLLEIFSKDAQLRVGKDELYGIETVRSWFSFGYLRRIGINFDRNDFTQGSVSGTVTIYSDEYETKKSTFAAFFKNEGANLRLSELNFQQGPDVPKRFLL